MANVLCVSHQQVFRAKVVEWPWHQRYSIIKVLINQNITFHLPKYNSNMFCVLKVITDKLTLLCLTMYSAIFLQSLLWDLNQMTSHVHTTRPPPPPPPLNRLTSCLGTRPPLNRSTSCLGRKGQVAILENSAIWRHTNVNNTRVLYTGYSYHMIREFEGELSGVLMERICRQWAEWWQMTSSSFVSPLDCLTSFLGISLSRAVSSFGRITNVPKLAITAES